MVKKCIKKIFVCSTVALMITPLDASNPFPKKTTQSTGHHKNLAKKYKQFLKHNPYPIVNNIVKSGPNSMLVEGYEGALPTKNKNIKEIIKAADLGNGDINCHIVRTSTKYTREHYIKVKYLFFWYIKNLYETQKLAQQQETKKK